MADVTSPFGFPYPEDTDLVRDGAQDIENLAQGVNDYLASGFTFAGQVTFESSGDFLKADPFGSGDIGVRAIRVRIVGAGGGGGGAGATGVGQCSAGGGGGGGGYAEKFYLAADLDASETVTRGAGGSGGTGASAGAAGGASSFKSMSAAGGLGGGTRAATATFPNTDAGGSISTGGVGSGGDINANGGAGMTLFIGGTSLVHPGNGGCSFYSGGAQGMVNTVANPGAAGVQGAGGSGAGNRASETAKNGGAGGNGIVVIDVFV